MRTLAVPVGPLVGVGGFEPPASWPQTRRSSLAELHPVSLRLEADTRRGQERKLAGERIAGGAAAYLELSSTSIPAASAIIALNGARMSRYSAIPWPACAWHSRRAALIRNSITLPPAIKYRERYSPKCRRRRVSGRLTASSGTLTRTERPASDGTVRLRTVASSHDAACVVGLTFPLGRQGGSADLPDGENLLPSHEFLEAIDDV